MNYLKTILPLLFIGCNSQLDKYYPYESQCITVNGEEKSFYPGNEIYIDNSKITDFELLMVYNTEDTVMCDDEKKKIYVIDTLKFNVTKNGVVSLNDKYPVEVNWNIFIKGENLISVQNGQNIEVIIKHGAKIIESYFTDLEYYNESGERINYKHIINPQSLSTYELDTVQYGGYIFKPFKSKRLFDRFITINGGHIDYFLTTPPDTLTYTEKRFGEISFDPCIVGCKKSVLTKLN